MLSNDAGPREELRAIADSLGLRAEFPERVEAEVAAILASPGIDDATLVDRTDLPFVTIDAATSRDLDQAVYVERDGDAYRVCYAIADASHYVRPGTALFEEAKARGASFYFPSFAVPMLPRALSEGIVSLNPDGPRRALLFDHRISGDGELVSTSLERARIRSRAKLSFGDVQSLVDSPGASPLSGSDFESSLFALRDVGRARMKRAESRGLVRYRREEVDVKVDGDGLGFVVVEAMRDEVELWNEQISLLCNAEGGRLLRENPSPSLQPVYRVQGGPEPERLDELARLTERVAALHSLPASPWVWDAARESLASYLRALPDSGALSREERVARALSRQAVMVNMRSEYTTEPGPHTGVGAEPYARFSAPMREVVGVFLHAQAMQMLRNETSSDPIDEALRDEIVRVANRARETQRRANDLANELVIDRLLAPELQKEKHDRTRFRATVMGITTGKVHLRLDAPPLDLKVYLFDLARFHGGARLDVVESGAALVVRGSTEPVVLLGEAVDLVVDRRDDKNRRWILATIRVDA